MIVIKALSLFHGNPQTSDLKPDFWNCFKKKQHFPCTSNTQLKGSEKEKAKKDTMEQAQELSCTHHDRTINNSTKAEGKMKKQCYPPPVSPPNPNINEPPLTLPSPHHVVTTQFSWYPWHKWGNLIDMELQAMMIYWVCTWDLVEALQSASPASCKTPATSTNSICPNNHQRRKNIQC